MWPGLGESARKKQRSSFPYSITIATASALCSITNRTGIRAGIDQKAIRQRAVRVMAVQAELDER